MTAVDQSQWEPTLQISTDTDINIVTRENKQYKMKYKSDHDEGIKKKVLQQQQNQGLCPIVGEVCKNNAKQDKCKSQLCNKNIQQSNGTVVGNLRTCHGLSRN